jgi:hypothetical protein
VSNVLALSCQPCRPSTGCTLRSPHHLPASTPHTSYPDQSIWTDKHSYLYFAIPPAICPHGTGICTSCTFSLAVFVAILRHCIPRYMSLPPSLNITENCRDCMPVKTQENSHV